MVDGPPEYCPSCGTAVTPVEAGSVYYCESCEACVFYNPTPNARVAVVDGDRILLVEIADEARIEDPPYAADSEWMLPGGHLEVGEQPHVAAARELEEETGLAVAPDALHLVDAVSRQVVEGAHSLVLLYAVDAAAADGTLAAATDAADARFWRPDELAGSDRTFRELHFEPPEFSDLRWLTARVRDAVAASDGSDR